jgi:dCTP deaminase
MKKVLRTQGVLPSQRLRELVQADIISHAPGYEIKELQFQPNSIDLRLGKKAYRVRSSFLPENERVEDKVERLLQYEFSIENGAVLEPNSVYIIPLLEQLNFGKTNIKVQSNLFNEGSDSAIVSTPYVLSGRANPKSSTGRLDVFTRLITDGSHRFDEINAGYSGNLYLEVVPKSFPVKVRTGQSMNQLRILHGQAPISDEDLLRYHQEEPILYDSDRNPVAVSSLNVKNGLFLRVDLAGKAGDIVGYKAKNHRSFIDLDKIGYYKKMEYWEPVYATQDDFLILEPEAFYIFASKDYIAIPPSLAAEMVAYDTGTGEIRSHYAGFFDSGFGYGKDRNGAKAVLEVRVHDVPFLIEDGQTICSMKFEANAEVPEAIYGTSDKNHYQDQKLKLGKQFAEY